MFQTQTMPARSAEPADTSDGSEPREPLQDPYPSMRTGGDFQDCRLPLDRRLALIASLVRPGSRVADVGTDHGYLICHLVGKEICPLGFASDINPQPLENARHAVQRSGLEDKVTLMLSDGLSELKPDDVDCVVIAGMGGDLICRMLQQAPWLKSPDKQLVLQPMTRSETVREYLCENGFAIREERAVACGHFIYTALSAEYTGEKVKPDEIFCLIGGLPRHPSMDAAGYVRQQSGIQRKKAVGLMRSSGHRTEAADCYRLAEVLSHIATQMEQAAQFKEEPSPVKDSALSTDGRDRQEKSAVEKAGG